MFTVCPRCTLTLAVTADDLRSGQGFVRCGRCLNVFNALLALSEETPDAQVPAYSQADPASSSQINRALQSAPQADAPLPPPPSLPVREPESAPEPTPEPAIPAPASTAADPAGKAAPAESALASAHPQLPTEVSGDGAFETESSLADGTGTFETIVLEGDAITQTEEFAPQASVDHEIAVLAQRLQSPPDNDAGAQPGGNADAGADPAAIEPSAMALSALDLGADDHAALTRRHRSAWLAGCVLLALLLLTQAINHWRDTLASVPSLSAPMTRLYKSLDVPLDPHWDLNAYDIRQQGAVSDPTDAHVIRVRLSVANRAARPQPAPVLRLTLLDRYGKRIAARDLAPADYWPKGQAPHAFLGHDERIDSEVAVRDQGPDSASFELDVCLRNLEGIMQCAGDTSPGAPGTT